MELAELYKKFDIETEVKIFVDRINCHPSMKQQFEQRVAQVIVSSYFTYLHSSESFLSEFNKLDGLDQQTMETKLAKYVEAYEKSANQKTFNEFKERHLVNLLLKLASK